MPELLAFEPFSTLQGVLDGKPIKIMPVGTFYRDSRKLVITPERLQSFEANLKAGLPRFKVPINENHAGVGKVGTVSDVAYLEAGPDGAGLYATGYELTEAGRKLIADKRFDAVSPETVWTLNDGATYQDPTTGKKHDNVLVGLALTDRPFFGHDNVALFSDMPMDTPKRHNGYTKLKKTMREQFEAWLSQLDEPAAPDAATQGEPMEPEKAAETAPAVEQFTVTKEEFVALQAQAADAKAQAEKFAADLAATKRERRLEQLTVRAEKFSALAVEPKTLAQHLMAIEQAAPEEFAWLDGFLGTLDTTIATGDLFKQVSDARKPANSAASINDVAVAIVAEKFGGDMGKYAEAFREAGKRRPDLAAAYIAGAKD